LKNTRVPRKRSAQVDEDPYDSELPLGGEPPLGGEVAEKQGGEEIQKENKSSKS
jgi:hypothetical protein